MLVPKYGIEFEVDPDRDVRFALCIGSRIFERF